MSSEGTESCCRSILISSKGTFIYWNWGGGGGMYAVIGSTMLFSFKNRLGLLMEAQMLSLSMDRIVYLINVYIVILYSL